MDTQSRATSSLAPATNVNTTRPAQPASAARKVTTVIHAWEATCLANSAGAQGPILLIRSQNVVPWIDTLTTSFASVRRGMLDRNVTCAPTTTLGLQRRLEATVPHAP